MHSFSTRIVSTPLGAGTKRGPTKGTKNKFLPPKATPGLSGTISRSGAASPALSGIVSPSLNPTLSATEQATEKAKELRAPIVHELAVREMSFEELRAKWLSDDDKEFKTALDTVADFDNSLQKYTLKRAYWKEIDAYKYDYESDDDRQTAIDNAIRNFDRLRLGANDPLWDKLNPKEERGKGKCLSKLLPKLAKKQEQPAAKTPQIKVNDAEDSSGSKNGDGSQSGVEKKKPVKKTSEPMSRSSSQTKQPIRKIEKKWVGKKAATPKVSPTKAATKTAKDKNGRVLSKEFISDSDSSSEEAPLSTTVPRARALEKEKAIEKEREEREKEREKLREEKEKERQKEREREREREREIEREKEREVEREREQREQREREREREREKDRLAEKLKEKEKREAQASVSKPKPKQSTAKDSIKAQVTSRPATQKRSREEHDDDSSSSSGTPLSKRNSREIKAAGTGPSHSTVSYKRPPSDSSSQTSSRSNSYAGNGYSKTKNTSPTKSSPLASSPPTNASDLEDRDRDLHRSRNVMVASSNINVKKRKVDTSSTDGDSMDVIRADRKRQRLSRDLLNDARLFKKFYEVYQRLHFELQADKNFSKEKYDTLIKQRKRLEDLKEQIYSQIPREVC